MNRILMVDGDHDPNRVFAAVVAHAKHAGWHDVSLEDQLRLSTDDG